MIPGDPDQIYKIAEEMEKEFGEGAGARYLNQAGSHFQDVYGRDQEEPQQKASRNIFEEDPEADPARSREQPLYDRIQHEAKPYERAQEISELQPQRQPSNWDQFRGYRQAFQDHMKKYGLAYGIGIPLLGAALLGSKDKKRRD